MIRLDATTRKLQAVLAGAITTSQLPCMVSYSDKTSTDYVGATQLANTNNTTQVDICAAPAASTVRDIDYVSVKNIDTASATVSIIYDDNATDYTVVKAALAVGDQLVYTHGNGWQVIASDGSTKTIGNTGATGDTGAQGPTGPPIFLVANDGEDGSIGPPGPAGISGTNGTNGATGAQGPLGPAVFLVADDGEEGMMGPPGSAGAASGAITSSGLTMSTARLLGRTTAATGAVEEITVGSGLSLAAGALTASGGGMPQNYITGLILANNGTDATNDIDIAIGSARDSTNAADMVLASALTKQLDATWAVGTNAGMLDVGTVGNLTYHLYLIKRSDTGVVDVLASLSATNSGTCTMTIASPCVVSFAKHGLQVGSSFEFSTTGALPTGVTAGTTYYAISTSFGVDSFQFSTSQGGAAVNTSGTQSGTHTLTHKPIMPANYDYKRRIGSIIRVSAANVGFTQREDIFTKKTPTLDINTAASGTSRTARTLVVPVGIVVQAMVQGGATSGTTNYCHFSALTDTDVAATDGFTAAPFMSCGFDGTTYYMTRLNIFTNTSAQIASRSTANDKLVIHTYGWIDERSD